MNNKSNEAEEWQKEEFPEIASAEGILEENETVYLVDKMGNATETRARGVFVGVAQSNPPEFIEVVQVGQQTQQTSNPPEPNAAETQILLNEKDNFEKIMFYLDGFVKCLNDQSMYLNQILETGRKPEFLGSCSDLRTTLAILEYYSRARNWHAVLLTKMLEVKKALLDRFRIGATSRQKLEKAFVKYNKSYQA